MIRTVDSDLGGLPNPKSASIIHWFTILMVTLIGVFLSGQASAQPNTTEYKIKTAFIINLVKFVEWPDISSDNNLPFIITVIGDVPIEEGQSKIPDLEINEKQVVMQIYHRWDPNSQTQTDNLNVCHALFITKSEQPHASDIIAKVKTRPVMTVGEFSDFLDSGGIFNFEIEKNKVRFSVNIKNAKDVGLSIRSKLLRLAKKVYK